MYFTQWKKNVFWFLYLHVGYVEDIKQLLFTLTKPEMAEVYSRYSAKAPEPLSAQFNDRIDKQSAVKAYNEKCGKVRNIPLFPSGISLSRFRCCFVLIFASHNSLLGNLLKKAILFTWCRCNLDMYFLYCDNRPATLFSSIAISWKCFNLYPSLSLSLSKRQRKKKCDYRSQIRKKLTNKFVYKCLCSFRARYLTTRCCHCSWNRDSHWF
mgnify:CR=1 FL=1